jgi:thioredoxin reductase (NADPH)
METIFNLDEVLEMAIRIEVNGRAFYLRMAEMYPDHAGFLTHLADEEISHQETFKAYRKKHAGKGSAEVFDPDGSAGLYLASFADSVIFQPLEKLDEMYAGRERIDQILEDAIAREQDSVNFFTGIKNVLTDKEQIAGIEEIIQEEMTHIGWLMAKRQEIDIQGITDARETVFELIIVGAGPGGVSMAAEAIDAGMSRDKILLLEQANRNSWIIRKLYPEQKLVTANYKGIDPVCNGVMNMRNMTKTDALQMLNSTIIDYDMQVLHEMKVHTVEKKGDLFEVGAGDHIFKSKLCAIGIGIFGKPNKPDYRIPAALKKMVMYDVTSMRVADCDALVVGGGDSSAEYARVLMDEGNRVTLASREDDLRYMNDENRAQTGELGASGKLNLLRSVNISGIDDDDQGRIRVNFEGDIESITVDRIIYALGGTTPMNFLQLSGVDIVDGEPRRDDWSETNVPGLFLLGDLAAKKSSGAIVHAFNNSYKIVSRLKEMDAGLFK